MAMGDCLFDHLICWERESSFKKNVVAILYFDFIFFCRRSSQKRVRNEIYRSVSAFSQEIFCLLFLLPFHFISFLIFHFSLASTPKGNEPLFKIPWKHSKQHRRQENEKHMKWIKVNIRHAPSGWNQGWQIPLAAPENVLHTFFFASPLRRGEDSDKGCVHTPPPSIVSLSLRM